MSLVRSLEPQPEPELGTGFHDTIPLQSSSSTSFRGLGGMSLGTGPEGSSQPGSGSPSFTITQEEFTRGNFPNPSFLQDRERGVGGGKRETRSRRRRRVKEWQWWQTGSGKGQRREQDEVIVPMNEEAEGKRVRKEKVAARIVLNIR
ncbi:hypothetical protein ACH5RR_025913 [Cinchona calisaya]|uniref:Uncharacterized protein n=1 Tax=Cinchona calisaya TaxID=153742 RepID=A0ABD2Z1E4_9GENT